MHFAQLLVQLGCLFGIGAILGLFGLDAQEVRYLAVLLQRREQQAIDEFFASGAIVDDIDGDLFPLGQRLANGHPIGIICGWALQEAAIAPDNCTAAVTGYALESRIDIDEGHVRKLCICDDQSKGQVIHRLTRDAFRDRRRIVRIDSRIRCFVTDHSAYYFGFKQ